MKIDPRTFWTSINHNKRIKAVSLLLAVITWYAIQPVISFESQLSDVPIRVLVDPGWAVLEQSASVADVHFRGSREAMRYLNQEQIEVVVDMRGRAYENAITVPLDLKQVQAPNGLRPAFIRPSELVLSVDQESEKVVPVRVHIQGSPPEGYEMETFSAVPTEVTISGPRLRLNAIDSIRTTPIDLEGRLQSFKLRVGLVPPSHTWRARIEPERVDVEVNLVERAAKSVFEDVRVKALLIPGQWRQAEIEPTHVTVELEGRSELLDPLTPKDFQVFVDCSGLEPGQRSEVPVQVRLPSKIKAASINPSRVGVTVGVRDVPFTSASTTTVNQVTDEQGAAGL